MSLLSNNCKIVLDAGVIYVVLVVIIIIIIHAADYFLNFLFNWDYLGNTLFPKTENSRNNHYSKLATTDTLHTQQA